MMQDQFSDAFQLSLKKSFLYRAQAVFLGRLSLNGLYLLLWLLAIFQNGRLFPHTKLDLLIIIIALSYTIICYHYRSHKSLGRWLHFITLALDIIIHILFTRTSGFILSPLMAIHPFLAAAFLLLFHNPLLMLAPLSTLPMGIFLINQSADIAEINQIFNALLINCLLDALAIFFIHFTHSNEQGLLRSMVVMQAKLKELAIVQERQRIAREFHDGVGAKMTSIVMQCDYLHMHNLEHGALQKELFEIKESAIESIDDMRRSIAFLNGDFDITDQMELLLQKVSPRHHMPITSSGIELLRKLGLEQQIACTRIVQECLTNTLKHAQAKAITITISEKELCLCLALADDGIGFDTNHHKKHHFGIKNMAERAAMLGARFDCISKPQQGTQIYLEIPVT